MDRAELDADKEIDVEQLDVECARHADIYFKWAERLVDATIEYEQLQLDFEVLEAKLQMEAREYPDKFRPSIANPTETAIKSAVRCSDRYNEAYRKLLSAKAEKMLLEKAERTMEIRKGELQNLIALWAREYFAGPALPRDLVGLWKDRRDKRDQKGGGQERQRAAARRRE